MSEKKTVNRSDYVAPQRACHATTTWNIDPAHSAAQFNVRHMMISNVKGDFAKIIGRLELDETDMTNSRVEASIDATTIRTREPQRDAHLKSADFFDVEKFPTLSFKSTHVSKRSDGELALAGRRPLFGRLTLCDVSANSSRCWRDWMLRTTHSSIFMFCQIWIDPGDFICERKIPGSRVESECRK